MPSQFVQRRDLLAVTAVGTTIQVSGCFGWAHRVSNPVGTLVVENRDDTSHDVHVAVTFLGEDSPRFERTFNLSSSGERTAPEIVEEGRYEVTAELDSGESVTDRWYVSACGEVRFRVRVTEEGELYIRQLDFCD